MNKIVKIALVASTMLVMSFTTGCYEVMKALGIGGSPAQKYCVVCMRERNNCFEEAIKCYELDNAFTSEQCIQLNNKIPEHNHFSSAYQPGGIKKCTKYQ